MAEIVIAAKLEQLPTIQRHYGALRRGQLATTAVK